MFDRAIEEGLLLGGAAQKYKWALSLCAYGAYRGNATVVTGADPAEGWGPASWLSSGTPPKPDVPALLPLAETEL